MAFAFQYLARSSSSGNTDAGKQWIYNGTATFGSNETLATIVASGYFNAAQSTLTPFTIAGATGSTGPLAVGDVLDIRGNDANGQYVVSSITTNVTLAVWNATSGVTYSGSPAVIGDLASFGDTSGDIVDSGVAATNLVLLAPAGDQSITAHNLLVTQGNLQAGSSGHAGTVASFPATGSKGSLILAGVANTGNTNTTISNAAMGQASVISIPDPGVSTSSFILADSAGTQNISTGSLDVLVGNITAGSSGHAGTVSSFPGTATKGSLVLAAVANTGNTLTTISNAAMGQASVVSIPDPAAATAKFVLDSGVQQMATGSELKLDKGTGTESSNAVTISKQSGVITTSSLTVTAGSTYVITLTNTLIATTSVVLTQWMGGTNTLSHFTISATAASGSSVITIHNNDAVTSISGTIIIGFAVV